METFEAVLTGVISSMIGTLIFLGSANIVRKSFIPWVEDKIYRGIRVDGHWTDIRIGEGANLFCSLDLKQKGDTVTGIYSHGNRKEKEKTTYRVQGEVRNTYLNASFWPISSKTLDSFTFLGRIEHKSQLQIKGIVAYIDEEAGGVASTEHTFVQDHS